MQVKRDKMEGLPSHNDLMTCLTSTTTRIPQLLDVMASNPTTATRTLLYGYMTLHWSCIYGHRPGVYSNMTNAEVRKADTTGTAFGYLVHVSNHKTANAFGEAQLYLTVEEFGWMKRWLEIKGTLTCTQSRYFLYTEGKNPFRKLAYSLRLAWADVGLRSPINFTDLRTVHADNAKRFQDKGNRQRVSDFMCHNTATTDTFYDHKTANSFGGAQLYLTAEEFGWMKRWLEIKGTLTCTQSRYFLYTEGKNPFRKLAYSLRMAWADVGLHGPINFTDLRTVHADNAKRFQDKDPQGHDILVLVVAWRCLVQVWSAQLWDDL
ncbi:uncharacterized protein [Pseudochaenichthys georgianus]|uniref:uncharacterized protein n=1 Tax=Pseudochaenichthys georgianus TaxID=52239 RepID=UPI0039C09C27